jgi:hypothetical protein
MGKISFTPARAPARKTTTGAGVLLVQLFG